MRPATDTVSIRVKPLAFGRLVILLNLFVVLSSFPAWAESAKPIVFVTDPPGAIVEKLSNEGEWDYQGLSGPEPVIILVNDKERDNDLRFRFSYKLLDGRLLQSEPMSIEGLKFLKSDQFPKQGQVSLGATVWDRVLIFAATRPFLAGLFGLGLPGLLVLAFVTRERWRPLLGGAKSQRHSEEGTTYGDYTVLGVLGKGAMGVVYMGENRAGAKVAIKSVLPEFAEDPEFALRFDHELRACVSLKHPNLLNYFGHGIDSDGIPFSVTELLQGKTLKQTITEGVENPQRLASDLIEQIGSALDYLHGQGLVHRDIKPDNIFVCDNGDLKLMDLGLVKGEAMTVLTRTGNVLGTPAYMSPEQFDGQTSPASDQYGLGIILYELLAGQRPFFQPDLFALAFQHKTATPEPLSTVEPRVPEEIGEVILRMLAKNPAERFGSIREIQDAISDKLLYLPWQEGPEKQPAPKSGEGYSETDPDSWTGKRIGNYRIDSFLGQGGMATVYKGVDVRSDRPVAIKVIQNKMAQDEQFRNRFQREAKIGEKLKHPNIVELLDWGEHEDHLYLVLEYVDGLDLSHEIKEGGRALTDVIGLIEPILDGLCYSHGLGVVHRDLKPENILLTADGTSKITDFGLARSEELAKLTKTGQAVGTPAYFPPEQVTGADPHPAADQYSLGILLYELLCGVRPFTKKLPMELLFQHLSEEPADLTDHRRDLSPVASAIILRMLAKSPEARFESLAVVREGLRAVADRRDWSLPKAQAAIEPAPISVSVSSTGSGPDDSGEDTMGFEVRVNED